MSMYCTFSPEDNKLRLYSVGRLDQETYERVKAAGFKWAPKQELFVAPAWTPNREDLLIELCGEIDDEDVSLAERSADRAERFGDYRDKRAGEAAGFADRFESGPAAFGHQNRARAERQATRHDRHRGHAVSQWGKAEYWQERTAAVIGHALYRSSAKVRRSRILRLEAEQRKHEKTREEYAKRFAAWSKVPTLDGATQAGRYMTSQEFIGFAPESVTPALKFAYALSNWGGWVDRTHPRTGRKASLYSLMTDPADPITPGEAAALWLENAPDPTDPDTYSARWSDHYENRLAYERAMLAAEGGTAADADMEPGGWIGSRQIQAVNRSNVTGKVVSVKLWGETSGFTRESGYKEYATRPTLVIYNIERLPEGAYRPPTDEERATFQTEAAEKKAERKASKPKAPPLVNPTDADAERLQTLWNDRARAKHDEERKAHRVFSDFKAAEVLRLTQEQYSANSKGAYAKLETRALHACGRLARRHSNMWSSEGARYAKSLGEHAATVRVWGHYDKADQVIVLTDKPQKPLPLDWAAVEAGTVEPAQTVETVETVQV